MRTKENLCRNTWDDYPEFALQIAAGTVEWGGQCACPTNCISNELKIQYKFVQCSGLKYAQPIRMKNLHKSLQLHCHDMCKIAL